MSSVEESLAKCAEYRGVGGIMGLSHRTIHEWAWFVEHMIFEKAECGATCMYPIACRKARDAMMDFEWNDPDTVKVMRRWAELFLVYWEEASREVVQDAKKEE